VAGAGEPEMDDQVLCPFLAIQHLFDRLEASSPSHLIKRPQGSW
jgi:hypothetical protein